MYIPALTVLLLYWLKFKKPVFRHGDLGFKLTGWKYWIIAPLVMSAISILFYGISWLINPAMFNSAETIKQELITKGFYYGSIFSGVLFIFFLNGFIGSIINIPMFIGEELG
jgi:hypothetical protein